jgi:hypothetical protein
VAGAMEIRRLRAAEASSIALVQPTDGRFRQYYPDHLTWVKRTIHEVEQGYRVALGAFVGDPRDAAWNFAGSVVLKKVTNQDVVEIKNLGVVPTVAGARSPAIKQHLLRRALAYVSARGFRRVEIEIPGYQDEELKFHLELRRGLFRIESLRHGGPSSALFYYRLGASLRTSYLGDPFDTSNVARWIVGAAFGFSPHYDPEESEDASAPGGPGQRAPVPDDFALPPGAELKSTFAFSVVRRQGHTAPVPPSSRPAGVCVVHDLVAPESVTRDDISRAVAARFPLVMVVSAAKSDLLAQHCRAHRVHYIDPDETRGILGPASTASRLTFSRDDLRGFTANVRSIDRQRVEERREPFFFVVTNGVGFNLKSHIDDGKKCFFLFRTDDDAAGAASPTSRVWGYSRVRDVDLVGAQAVKDNGHDYPAARRIWSDEELDYFASQFVVNYNEGRKLAVFELDPVVVVAGGVPIADVASASFLGLLPGFDEDEESRPGDDEQLEIGLESSYVDAETMDAFMSRPEVAREARRAAGKGRDRPSPVPPPSKSVRVFISYPHNESPAESAREAEGQRVQREIVRFRAALYRELRYRDSFVTVFVDSESLRPGDRLSAAIETELGLANVFLPLLSPLWFQRPWCIREHRYFMAQKQARKQVACVLPIRWVTTPDDDSVEALDAEAAAAARELGETVVADWTGLRHQLHRPETLSASFSALADAIRNALSRTR